MLRPITTDTTHRLACLVIGPAGIGKTSLLRTLCGQEYNGQQWQQSRQEPQKPFVLSAEGGLLCVHDLLQNGWLEGFEIGSLEDFKEAQRYCYTKEFVERECQWIFIYSLTEIANRCARNLQEKYPGKNDSFKLWGEYDQIMTDIVKSFRDMYSFNVIFTCLEEIRTADNGVAITQPAIEGSKLKNRLTSYFDLVLRMQRDPDGNGGKIVVFTTQSDNGLTKDRSGKLQQHEAPNLLYIQQKIFS